MMVGLRAKLFMPFAAIGLIWASYILAHQGDTAVAPQTLLLMLLALVVAIAANVELLVLRPLRALVASVQELAQPGLGGAPAEQRLSTFRELASALDRLRE